MPRAHRPSLCELCWTPITRGEIIGQHPNDEGSIVWVHNRCIPHQTTLTWNGTPSGSRTAWRRRPSRRPDTR